jgi:predicted RNase H-like nuclease
MRHAVRVSDPVLGVDGCAKGWVGILLADDGVRGLFAPTIGELERAAREFGEVAVMGVDMPIGLPDTGVRRADGMARRFVGPRSSSVFSTPVRAAVELDVYELAAQAHRTRADTGLTKQSFALWAKIREVEAWLPTAGCRVVEVHPEVSFAALAQEPLIHPKKTWSGVELRRGLLATASIVLPPELGLAGARAGVDDVLDAAVAAWSAARVRDGLARSMPDPPEPSSDGIPAAIWY